MSNFHFDFYNFEERLFVNISYLNEENNEKFYCKYKINFEKNRLELKDTYYFGNEHYKIKTIKKNFFKEYKTLEFLFLSIFDYTVSVLEKNESEKIKFLKAEKINNLTEIFLKNNLNQIFHFREIKNRKNKVIKCFKMGNILDSNLNATISVNLENKVLIEELKKIEEFFLKNNSIRYKLLFNNKKTS